MSKRSSKAFTLIELLVVLSIIGVMFAFSITGISNFRNTLDHKYAVKEVLMDINYTRQLASTTHSTCTITFRIDGSTYLITQGAELKRSSGISKRCRFEGKSYFSFLPSGMTTFAGSGTLVITGNHVSKKIIVSQRGRVRVE